MAAPKTKPCTQKSAGSKTHIMLTLPPSTRKEIEQLAKKEDRPLTYICRRFIEQGLNNIKKKPASK